MIKFVTAAALFAISATVATAECTYPLVPVENTNACQYDTEVIAAAVTAVRTGDGKAQEPVDLGLADLVADIVRVGVKKN